MTPRQFVTLVILCATVPCATWAASSLSFGTFTVENAATQVGDWDTARDAIALLREAPSLDGPPATAVASLSEAPASDPIATDPAFKYDAKSDAIPLTPEARSFDVPSATAVASLSEAPSSGPFAKEPPFKSDPNSDANPLALEVRPLHGPLAAAVTSLGEAATSDVIATEPAVESLSAVAVPVVEAAPLDPGPESRTEASTQLASLVTGDVVDEKPKPARRPLETPDECLAAETCVDEYLWSLYEKTPKVDTNKLTERVRKTVKKNGKTRSITTTITKYVVGDFTWKDPAAAEKAGMSLKAYVIGGMDRRFKLTLYRALRIMDGAGFMPGITSAFRDDYRQSIATGNKAASDSSYHGGSRRGGFGYGLAADLVSLKGNTRLERCVSSEELWKWIDAHEKELGIGRPYRDRDPPHVGPLDGKEYADKRGRANVQSAGSRTNKAQTAKVETKKHEPTPDDRTATKHARAEKSSSKVSSLQSRLTSQR